MKKDKNKFLDGVLIQGIGIGICFGILASIVVVLIVY
jgi:hypothetical protein